MGRTSVTMVTSVIVALLAIACLLLISGKEKVEREGARAKSDARIQSQIQHERHVDALAAGKLTSVSMEVRNHLRETGFTFAHMATVFALRVESADAGLCGDLRRFAELLAAANTMVASLHDDVRDLESLEDGKLEQFMEAVGNRDAVFARNEHLLIQAIQMNEAKRLADEAVERTTGDAHRVRRS